MANKILITGATGNTGSVLVPILLADGHDVRIFARNKEKAQAYEDAGAEVIIGDLDNASSIDEAVREIDKIYLLTWNGPTQEQQCDNVLAAIDRVGGNPHIARHSAFGSDKSRLITQINNIDEKIKTSGHPWTILRPTFFMQNIMMAAQTIASDGMIYWDWAEGKAGMIDVRDIADSAFAILTGKGHEGKSYILTGPESVSFHHVASVFSEVLGKEVKYMAVPFEASKQSMMQMGFLEWIVDGYVELSMGFSENFADRVTDNVEKITGHPARSIKTFVSDFNAVFGDKPIHA